MKLSPNIITINKISPYLGEVKKKVMRSRFESYGNFDVSSSVYGDFNLQSHHIYYIEKHLNYFKFREQNNNAFYLFKTTYHTELLFELLYNDFKNHRKDTIIPGAKDYIKLKGWSIDDFDFEGFDEFLTKEKESAIRNLVKHFD